MIYYKALNDHSFYSLKGKLIFATIKDELLTLNELKRILSPYYFNIDVIIDKYFTKLSLSTRKTHFSFGVRIEDK